MKKVAKSDSILNTVKTMLGPTEDYVAFDTDIIVHINSAFERLRELGIGPNEPFFIESDAEKWDDFDTDVTWQIIRYIVLYVKRIFDPTANATIKQTYDEEIQKLEWLMNSVAEVGY